MRTMFRELWEYRPMLYNLVKREIRGRYKGSALGFIWNFLLPFAQIVVYIMVFTIVFSQSIEDYYVYLIAGMVPWIMFSDSLVAGSGSIVDNSQLVSKIYFPRAVVPISVVVSKFVNFLISIGIIYIILIIGGHGVNPITLLILPIAAILLLLFSLGLALLLSALHVYLRDTMYMVTVITMIWIWMTPIMYIGTNISNTFFQTILTLNPMTYFCEMFQYIFYWSAIPSGLCMAVCIILAFAALFIGCYIFNRLSKNFAEVL